MHFSFPLNSVPCQIVIGVQTNRPQEIKIQASDSVKPYTFFQNRTANVDGYREFQIKLPQAPKNLALSIWNSRNGNYPGSQDPTFIIPKIEATALPTRPIWMSAGDKEFVEFAQWFALNCALLSATVNGRPSVYQSRNKKFSISFFDKLYNKATGKFVNTPARIGHKTGIIEVSKADFLGYTVPMRMIILLHEYSHKYKNPQIGQPISYETGADINGLNMYLSLGYSPIEAHYAFLYVFRGANNEMNRKRYMVIKDFIKKFENGQLEKYYTEEKGRSLVSQKKAA